jgi:signal transduction histidine kinase/ligand-binding sensor domain-containing protein
MNPGATVGRADMRRSSLMAAGMLLVCCSGAFALNPTLDVSQYAHTPWKISDGLFKGVIFAIAQTPDGYLWLGTEFGLLRFDGVRTVVWQPPPGERLPSSDIRSLWVARDGRLWVGTTEGLVSWKDRRLTHYPELDRQVIEALLEDREGTIWVAGWAPSVGRLCQIQSGMTQCSGEDGRFGSGVTALYEDRGGNLWAGGMTGLWRWKPGSPQLYPMPDPAYRINALIESDDGSLVIAKSSGITKLTNGNAQPYPLPAGLQFAARRMLRDRDGGLWIGAPVDMGLLHIHDGRMDLFTRSDGLSGNAVTSILEDREGNIWVATVDGLDRFRDFAIPTISVQQGLSSHGVLAILAATDGSLWLGTDRGLNRWKNGQITIYRKRSLRSARGGSSVSALAAGWAADSREVREITDDGLPADSVESLFEDHRGQIWVTTQSGVAILKSDRFFPVSSVPYGLVFAITGDRAGNVWMSHQEGLFHLLQERVVERLPWARLGRREPATAAVHDPVRGGVWLGFRDGGVAHFKDGQLRASYAGGEGLAEGLVGGFRLDGDGTLWAATEGGLGRIKDGRALTLTSRNGLPCDTVHWMKGDDAGSVWLYMACGLVRVARSELDAWASHPELTLRATVFDSVDGVRSHRFHFGYSAIVTKSADGKLWFVPSGGVSVIDPRHLPGNTLPPPVHIEQITVNGRPYEPSNGLRVPAGVRDLSFDFTALSLVVPENVRFRVKLEGQDQGWRELVNQRQVRYTNLAPLTYRFRVLAANNSGVWNEDGATLEFSIAPAYYQTRWFAVLVGASAFVILWAGYRVRVRQVARVYQRRLDERVNERTRIARELHDTLLQSFHGLLLRFQTASYLLPARPAEAKEKLDGAIEHAAKAITEGRDAVQGLRASTVERNDLAVAVRTLGDELATYASADQPPTFSVAVEGQTRDLHPIVRDDIYKIAAEALRNAFRHAQAGRVEVEIRYDTEQFRLRVRDDGKGIDPAVLAKQGLEGHYGLRGIPERAAVIGGKLAVWSEVGAGTEVELRLPARIAYATSPRRTWWSRVLAPRRRHKIQDDSA